MKKTSELQLYLSVTAVVAFVVSNIISVKQIALPFGFVVPAAVIVFPVTYILSDVFSEVYGYRWSRITCYMSFLCNIAAVGIFALTIVLRAPDYWTQQDAYKSVLGASIRTLAASMLAYVLGDFANDNIFKCMKEKHAERGFGLRAILSSFAGEFVDSLVFVPVAFYGLMPNKTLATMIIVQPLLKVAYEIIILPLTVTVVKKVRILEQ